MFEQATASKGVFFIKLDAGQIECRRARKEGIAVVKA